MARELKVLSSMATRKLLTELLAAYTRVAPEVAPALESVGGVDATKRVLGGEAVDLVVLDRGAIAKLEAAGSVLEGSAAGIVASGVAVAVHEDAPHVEIGSEEALKRAVLAARSISYSTGPSGAHLASVFERWGIDGEIEGRIVTPPPGVPVGSLVAKGEVELGFQQFSELMGLPGITVLGPLPEAVQATTVFTGAVAAASRQPDAVRELLAWLVSPATAEIKRRHGMEPA